MVNSEVILVGGYGGKQDSRSTIESNMREACWLFHSYINEVQPSAKKVIIGSLNVIVNDSDLFSTSEKNVRELQQMLMKMMTTSSYDGINRVIIAHSHGANVVYEALKQGSLERFLVDNGVGRSRSEYMVKQIRHRLAVFTLGGTQDIPECFALLCVNFRLNKDRISVMAKPIIGENHGKTVQRVILEEEVLPKVKRQKNSFFKNLFASASASSAASSSDHGDHYLKEYYHSEQLMETIMELLENAK